MPQPGIADRRSRLRRRLVEGPGSLGERTRARRWATFHQSFPDLRDMSVVDLGGRVETWTGAPVRPRSVLVVNLEYQTADRPEWVEAVVADACTLPTTGGGRRYDVAFSNAVIEHVGGHLNRCAFARAVEAVSDRHWVQTPYRYFPVEPHYLFPAFQFLPLNIRARVLRSWPLVHTPPKDLQEALSAALDVELVSRTELAYLFPRSRLIAERWAGLTKSLIALRT